jgi:UDP-2-acetamido-3-amino-2,3-dideoxy-glucuronate N-acetyltransferase
MGLYQIPLITDARGSISMAEIGSSLPFVPQRYFVVFDVPENQVRGEHAHKECRQFLVCLKGSVSVKTDDGALQKEVLLNSPAHGLYVPPMVWGMQFNFSADAILLVLASHKYDAAEYIRDYDEFLKAVGKKQAG